jgi:hypothetical protein
MPRGSIGGGKPSLLELAFHGTHGRKLVRCILNQFSEIPLFVASMGRGPNVSAISGLVVLVEELLTRMI